MPSARPLKAHAFGGRRVLRALYTRYSIAGQPAIRNIATAPRMTNARRYE
jgi:hypothetical protein